MSENGEVKEESKAAGKAAVETQAAKAAGTDVTDMNEKQLLIKIYQETRKQAKAGWVSAWAHIGIFIVLTISLFLLVPTLINTLKTADTAIKDAQISVRQINVLVDSAQSSLTKIDEAVNNANVVIKDNSENVTDAVQKIDNIDFDSLNSSIQRLNDSLEPFANTVNLISSLTGGGSN
ncbi:MAG: hypothetical protein LKJ76_01800 [Lachnospiraceae bacterium]|jgi:hypothetical protein|nr:hypothetical protein [Lachnospiraceae bacterium]